MEGLVKDILFNAVYSNRRVLVTGHTGFKGSWLLLWLKMLGAEVKGYSLQPLANLPAHIDILGLLDNDSLADIRNAEHVKKVCIDFQPEIVFHLAAQPLVRRSYIDPLETITTNIVGTANLMEAIRHTESVRAFINITTDKVYADKQTLNSYQESAQLGGSDPYSASKACVELLHQCYHEAFYKNERVYAATVRAGNVIGGADWSEDRLIPDLIKAKYGGQKLVIRNPNYVRPWQHVLDPLAAYLLIGQLLFQQQSYAVGAWNIGPDSDQVYSVARVIELMQVHLGTLNWGLFPHGNQPKETALLSIDNHKAKQVFGWKPILTFEEAVSKTASWYKAFYELGTIESTNNLLDFIQQAKARNAVWVS